MSTQVVDVGLLTGHQQTHLARGAPVCRAGWFRCAVVCRARQDMLLATCWKVPFFRPDDAGFSLGSGPSQRTGQIGKRKTGHVPGFPALLLPENWREADSIIYSASMYARSALTKTHHVFRNVWWPEPRRGASL
jgi:hypothetical protein